MKNLNEYFLNAIRESIKTLNNNQAIIDYYGDKDDCTISDYFESQISNGKLYDSTEVFSEDTYLCKISDYEYEFECQRRSAFEDFFNDLVEETDENNLTSLSESDIEIDCEGVCWFKDEQADMMDAEYETVGDSLFERIFRLMGENACGQNVCKAAIIAGAKYFYKNDSSEDYIIYFWKNIQKTTLEIYKTRKDELIAQAINLLPDAMRGDRVNRTFFFEYDSAIDEVKVDYFVYCGQQSVSDNCFLTIKDTESFDPEDFCVEDFNDIDFRAIGWEEKIEENINYKIEWMEENERYSM
jgi:hypothetical protein